MPTLPRSTHSLKYAPCLVQRSHSLISLWLAKVCLAVSSILPQSMVALECSPWAVALTGRTAIALTSVLLLVLAPSVLLAFKQVHAAVLSWQLIDFAFLPLAVQLLG